MTRECFEQIMVVKEHGLRYRDRIGYRFISSLKYEIYGKICFPQLSKSNIYRATTLKGK